MESPVREVQLNNRVITLIGTGHVFEESVQEVRRRISELRPDVVAVELDIARLYALSEPVRKAPSVDDFVKSVDKKQYLFFSLLFYVQQRAADTMGLVAGVDMLAAVKAAKDAGIPCVLIDKDIQSTLNAAVKGSTLTERLKFVSTALYSLVFTGDRDTLIEVMDNRDALMVEFEREYPSFYRALVTERNIHMACELAKLESRTIVAVVGAGHVAGIEKILTSQPSHVA